MKSIKIALIVLLFGTTILSANANKFTDKKEIALNHLIKKIELLNIYKSCINSSTSTKDMKSCQQTFKGSRKLLRAKTKAKREALKSSK